MQTIRLLIAFLAIAFAILIVWAIGTDSFSQAGAWLVSQPWGLVTLADLYFGFFLCAVVIWCFEENPGMRLLWILPIPFLGNVWTALWFIIRLPQIFRRLGARD